MGRKPKSYSTERKDKRRVKSKVYTGDEPFNVRHYCGRKYFYGKDDDEINQKKSDFEESLKLPAVSPSALMEAVVDAWWEEKEPELSPNTVQSYKTKKNEIIDIFGKMPASEITADMIEDWLTTFADKGYSQHSISDRRSIIKNIMKYAQRKLKVITDNPCIDLQTIKGVKKKKRKPALEEDVKKLEEHKTDSLCARMFYFMEYTGCRIGECVVLQQKDIDREHHKATISKDIAFVGNVPLVKENPKTEAGIREVDLYDNVLEILPEYDDPETYVFFPDGLPHRSRLQRVQNKFFKDTGITSTAHQFRHTYASIMHSARIDAKDTQARMGHANISVTQDIYTDIEKQHNEKIRNAANDYIMNERLGRNKKKCPQCGNTHLSFEDGHVCKFCPECGIKLV